MADVQASIFGVSSPATDYLPIVPQVELLLHSIHLTQGALANAETRVLYIRSQLAALEVRYAQISANPGIS